MRVLVCGGRNYADREAVARELEECWRRAKHDCLRIIQGGATGADALAREWCVRRFVSYENYPADWKKHGKPAGPIRNARMIAEGRPEIVITFPGGRGTADMIRQAEAAGIPVRRIAASELSTPSSTTAEQGA